MLKRVLFLSVFVLLVACGSEGGQTAVTQPTPIADATTAPTAVPQPTSTSIPTATIEPTATVDPAVTPSPTPEPTATVPPTPTIPPAPHLPDVEQPAYTASECSDRFPCNEDITAWEARIQVPDGFEVDYFAYLPNPENPERPSQPTSMTFGPDGLLYVATMGGQIFTVDENGTIDTFFEGLTVPTGIAFQPGTDKLFVSNRILDHNVGGEAQVSVIENGEARTLFAGLPCCYIGMHGPNGIAFGPDGYGYVGVGGRADHGEILDGTNTQDEILDFEAVILRFDPETGAAEVYARGFRNPYDIAWDTQGNLWAGDNGRDGNPNNNDIVPDELHLVVPGGEHGYPYYDCPACFGIPEGVEVIEPWFAFDPHAVPTGVTGYQGSQFPGYHESIFVTLWTALPFAERVMRFTPDGEASTFATGFAAPMDVVEGPDGSLYVTDFATGIIFKITHTG